MCYIVTCSLLLYSFVKGSASFFFFTFSFVSNLLFALVLSLVLWARFPQTPVCTGLAGCLDVTSPIDSGQLIPSHHTLHNLAYCVEQNLFVLR